MGSYNTEQHLHKCHHLYKHQEQGRYNGVCPHCLIERLSALCPDCANLRSSCSCLSYYSSSSLSSSSATSSFSIPFQESPFGRMSTLIENEPPFYSRSSSSAFPFFRSVRKNNVPVPVEGRKSLSNTIISVVFGFNSKRVHLTRSKSVSTAPIPVKNKTWFFSSPIKFFRNSKTSKVAHQKSPLYRL